MIRMYMVGAILVALLLLIVSQMYLMPTVATAPAPSAIEGLTNLSACPGGLKEYTTNSAVNCCEGEVLGGKCQGTPKCTLSAKSGDLPQCTDYHIANVTEKATRNCPQSMPYYYEVEGQGICTSAPLKSDGSGPLDTTNALFCNILATPEERYRSTKSCLNVRRLEEMKITTSEQETVTKNIISQAKDKPVLLAATITSGLKSRICYDRYSAEIFLDATNPQWRSDPQIVAELARMQQSGEFCA